MYDGRLTINTASNILLNVSYILCFAKYLTDKFIVFVVKLVQKWASNPRIIIYNDFKYGDLGHIEYTISPPFPPRTGWEKVLGLSGSPPLIVL